MSAPEKDLPLHASRLMALSDSISSGYSMMITDQDDDDAEQAPKAPVATRKPTVAEKRALDLAQEGEEFGEVVSSQKQRLANYEHKWREAEEADGKAKPVTKAKGGAKKKVVAKDGAKVFFKAKREHKSAPKPDMHWLNISQLRIKAIPLGAKLSGAKPEEGRMRTRISVTAPWHPHIAKNTLTPMLATPFMYWIVLEFPTNYECFTDGLFVSQETVLPWLNGHEFPMRAGLIEMVNNQAKPDPPWDYDQCKAWDDVMKADPLRCYSVWPDRNVTPPIVPAKAALVAADAPAFTAPKGYSLGAHIRRESGWVVFECLQSSSRVSKGRVYSKGQQFFASQGGRIFVVAVDSVGYLESGAEKICRIACVRLFDTTPLGAGMLPKIYMTPYPWLDGSDLFVKKSEDGLRQICRNPSSDLFTGRN